MSASLTPFDDDVYRAHMEQVAAADAELVAQGKAVRLESGAVIRPETQDPPRK